jgi:hypothetical protein
MKLLQQLRALTKPLSSRSAERAELLQLRAELLQLRGEVAELRATKADRRRMTKREDAREENDE